LSSQFFADPTLFSLLRQYYSIDGNKVQPGSNPGSTAIPSLSSPRTEETDGNGSRSKNKGVAGRPQTPASSSRKRKTVLDECNEQEKDGQGSSLRAQNNKRVKRRNKKDAQDSSCNVSSSSFSNTTVPAVSISSITAKSRKVIDPNERPELSAMENRFWEMAALLDSSPLASLK